MKSIKERLHSATPNNKCIIIIIISDITLTMVLRIVTNPWISTITKK